MESCWKLWNLLSSVVNLASWWYIEMQKHRYYHYYLLVKDIILNVKWIVCLEYVLISIEGTIYKPYMKLENLQILGIFFASHSVEIFKRHSQLSTFFIFITNNIVENPEKLHFIFKIWFSVVLKEMSLHRMQYFCGSNFGVTRICNLPWYFRCIYKFFASYDFHCSNTWNIIQKELTICSAPTEATICFHIFLYKFLYSAKMHATTITTYPSSSFSFLHKTYWHFRFALFLFQIASLSEFWIVLLSAMVLGKWKTFNNVNNPLNKMQKNWL